MARTEIEYSFDLAAIRGGKKENNSYKCRSSSVKILFDAKLMD
jgi:hypothetical protein